MLGLITAREIRERWRSGGFWVSTWLSVAAVILAIAAPSLGSRGAAPLRLATVGTIDAGTQHRLLALVTAPEVLDLATMPTFVDDAEARAQLRAHAVDLVVLGPDRILTLAPLDRSSQDRRTTLALAVESVLASDAALRSAGLSEPTIAKVQTTADAVAFEAVDSTAPVVDRGGRRTTAAIGIALVVVLTIVYGSWMLDGVLEEKSSRVAEVLLVAVRPGQLVRGKVAGVGVVAVVQSLLLAATALGASGVFASSAGLADNKRLVLAVLAWFLLGYTCFGSAFAAVGAFSRRHAEAQAASFLLLSPLLCAAAVAAPPLMGRQPSGLLRVLSLLPFTSPVAMPARQAIEHVPTVELFVAGGGLLVVATGLLALAGWGYGRAALDPSRSWLPRRRKALVATAVVGDEDHALRQD